MAKCATAWPYACLVFRDLGDPSEHQQRIEESITAMSEGQPSSPHSVEVRSVWGCGDQPSTRHGRPLQLGGAGAAMTPDATPNGRADVGYVPRCGWVR